MNINEIELAKKLIKFKSVTPNSNDVIDYIITILEPIGFDCHKYIFNNVANLYAKWGQYDDNICFAGHVDVIPEGNIKDWQADPWGADIKDDTLFGRGIVDMKGAIASFISAAQKTIKEDPKYSISIMLTGDEEGDSLNGMVPLLQELNKINEKITFCIVGEPTSSKSVGDTIKIGRRGSINFELIVKGIQGHVAYPDLAKNPIDDLIVILNKLNNIELDNGNEFFDKSRLTITSIDVGNMVTNVIPSEACAKFNIRFNDIYSTESLKTLMKNICDESTNNYTLNVISASDSFICKDQDLIDLITKSIKNVTDAEPSLSTSGGTSDARFIKNYYPVIELGLINKTMHKIDECCNVDDIVTLGNIYEEILDNYND